MIYNVKVYIILEGCYLASYMGLKIVSGDQKFSKEHVLKL